MNILGIESSCDETAVSVVNSGTNVLSNVISSSKDDFATLGGVVPEIAARKQIQYIMPVIQAALTQANLTMEHIDAIAVATEPGLLVSLLVGRTAARALASIWSKPLIEVHHTIGHLCSIFLEERHTVQFPALALSISGGHTELWYRESPIAGRIIGETRDDAVGEAFDKGASLLGLGYPGGPEISRIAAHGNDTAHTFPLPLRDDPTFDWSFSGLKTALKNAIIDYPDISTADMAASYEKALCDHLLDKLTLASAKHCVREIHVVGGVSANTRLRTMLCSKFSEHSIRFPKRIEYCTDNGAMIASAGYFLTAHSESAKVS